MLEEKNCKYAIRLKENAKLRELAEDKNQALYRAEKIIHLYAFIITTMKTEPYQIIRFYCGKGRIENFIKEGKNGLGFASVSSSSKLVNRNCLVIHALAYNLFNWFRRLALAVSIRKQRINTIRLKLIKIAARMVRTAQYKCFKLCSRCPYKKELFGISKNNYRYLILIF